MRNEEKTAAEDEDGSGTESGAVRRWLRGIGQWRPVRALVHYARNRGPLLAAGLSFHSMFAVFAALWVGFSVGGLVLGAEPALQDEVFRFLDHAVPGLIDRGGRGGAIEPDLLKEAKVLSWTGGIALLGLTLTLLGWLAAARDAVRVMFGLGKRQVNPVLLKLKDLALAAGLGVAVLISAVLQFMSTEAFGVLDGLIDSEAIKTMARLAGNVLMFAFNALLLLVLFRVLARIKLPPGYLMGGVLPGAAGILVLQLLGSRLLLGAANNPLLASFAVIMGLLVWFHLVSHVILLSASWLAVGHSRGSPGVLPRAAE